MSATAKPVQDWTARDWQQAEERFAQRHADREVGPEVADWAEDAIRQCCGRHHRLPHEPGCQGGRSTVAVTLGALVGGVLFVLAVFGGQEVLCDVHDGALRYCDGYAEVQR